MSLPINLSKTDCLSQAIKTDFCSSAILQSYRSNVVRYLHEGALTERFIDLAADPESMK